MHLHPICFFAQPNSGLGFFWGGGEEGPTPGAHPGLRCRTCSSLQVSALLTIPTQPHLLIPVRMQHKGSPDYMCTDALAETPITQSTFLSAVSKSVKCDQCVSMLTPKTIGVGFNLNLLVSICKYFGAYNLKSADCCCVSPHQNMRAAGWSI